MSAFSAMIGNAPPPVIRRHRSETFEHAISGLLTKRSDLAAEATALRDRLAEIKADMTALDRVLGILDYQGDPAAAMPGAKRTMPAGSGTMTRRIAGVLREAGRPMATAEVAAAVTASAGVGELAEGHPRRISKALWRMAQAGRVTQAKDELGRVVWRLGSNAKL